MNGYISTDVLLTEVHARHERLLAEAQQERLARASRAAAADRDGARDRTVGHSHGRVVAALRHMLWHRAA